MPPLSDALAGRRKGASPLACWAAPSSPCSGRTGWVGLAVGPEPPTAGPVLALAILALPGDRGFSTRITFVLLLLGTVLLYTVACLGLNLQFGYAGVLNFAGAAFFGVGGYTAAVLKAGPPCPTCWCCWSAGLLAAAVGSLLLLPLLRTRGHYAALITIAFGLLFRTFLEVNESLGGPQGLKLRAWRFWGFVQRRLEIGTRVVLLLATTCWPPRAARRCPRGGAPAGTLLDGARPGCRAARRDGGGLLRAGRGALENRRLHPGQLAHRHRRRTVRR